MIKNIAYKGEKFTIEWYFEAENKSSVLEYYNNLSEDRKKQIFKLFQTMGNFGKIFNIEKFRNEGDQIYAFKPSEDRFLCFFFIGSKIVVTNAFEKKTKKLPPREKQRALNYMKIYIQRHGKLNYD